MYIYVCIYVYIHIYIHILSAVFLYGTYPTCERQGCLTISGGKNSLLQHRFLEKRTVWLKNSLIQKYIIWLTCTSWVPDSDPNNGVSVLSCYFPVSDCLSQSPASLVLSLHSKNSSCARRPPLTPHTIWQKPLWQWPTDGRHEASRRTAAGLKGA